MARQLLSVKEAAERKGVNRTAVTYHALRGHLTSIVFSNRRRYIVVDQAYRLWHPKADPRAPHTPNTHRWTKPYHPCRQPSESCTTPTGS